MTFVGVVLIVLCFCVDRGEWPFAAVLVVCGSALVALGQMT